MITYDFIKNFDLNLYEEDFSEKRIDFKVEEKFSHEFAMNIRIPLNTAFVDVDIKNNSCMQMLLIFTHSGNTEVNYYPLYGYFHFVNREDNPEDIKQYFQYIRNFGQEFKNTFANPYQEGFPKESKKPLFFQVFCLFHEFSTTLEEVSLHFKLQSEFYTRKIWASIF